jgi:class 3 adenylate cyclase/tetratricopeptide (TPR) repeat protein
VDVGAWLRQLGLERYEPAFQDQEIEWEVLPELSETDLERLGIPLGPRKKLLKAMAMLAETGVPSSPEADAKRTTIAPQAAERRQLTVMFVDLVGSTELAARLDPEDMGGLLRAYQGAVAGEVARFEGHIAKYMGDGVLAYFGWPRAHEDEAERAVRAGLAIQGAIGRLAAPEPLAVRMGIATGLVMVGDLVGEGAAREEAVVGETPNLAARLQGLAAPGTVVIADATRRLLGGLFELEDLGAQHLKGFAEAVRAFRLVGEGPAESRFEARHGAAPLPLVGREQELALLLDRWGLARAGEGQVVLLSGEAGIGKSRLVLALRERLRQEPPTSLRYFCSPYHTNSALHPVIAQLERAAGFARDDPPAVRLEKLDALLAQAVADAGETTALLSELLGLSAPGRERPELTPQQRRARTFQALLAQLEGLAARQPVLMVLEDAHWLDPTSLELFGLVVDRIQRLPVLLVVTHRPEFQPPWRGYPHVTTLTLNRLGRAQAQAMVGHLTGGRALPAALLDPILLKTEGVPLFVEELTKTVLETGLVRDAGERWELSGPLPPLAIPTSLQDSLMARLDRLAAVKDVAQIAACIGREFDHELLAAVAGRPEAELCAALDQLLDAELIFRRGTPPEATYTFKHALVHDVAYENLLKTRRQALHARISDMLAESEEVPRELVALHAAKAGRPWQAAALMLEAGRQAYIRSAVHEAVAHLRSALHELTKLSNGGERDTLETEVHLSLAQVLLAARGWSDAEAGDHFTRAGALASRVGSFEQRVAALFGAFQYRMTRQDFQAARPLAEEMLELAEASDDDGRRIVAHRSLGALAHYTGNPAAANRHLRRAIDLHDPVRHASLSARYGFEFRSGAMVLLAISLVSRGLLREGLALADQALAHEEELRFRHSWCHTACLASYVLHFARLDARLANLAERFTCLATEQGFAYLRARGEILVGLVQARAGMTNGIELLRHGIAGVATAGTRLGWSYDRAILAEALLAIGHEASAMEVASDAVSAADSSGEHFFTAALLNLSAVAARRQGLVERAERDLQRAIAMAREREMRLFELRAATNLARLWAERGERQKAYDLLAPVYGWFTEGFDTEDLKEAKSLLDALA